MRILLIGHVCIDINEGETSSYTSWGSALMYMANFFQSKLNNKPILVAPYGKDFLEYSSGISLMPRPNKTSTLVYRNFLNESPRRWTCENIDNALPPPISKNIRREVAAADIICLAPLLPNYNLGYVSELLSNKKDDALSLMPIYSGNVTLNLIIVPIIHLLIDYPLT